MDSLPNNTTLCLHVKKGDVLSVTRHRDESDSQSIMITVIEDGSLMLSEGCSAFIVIGSSLDMLGVGPPPCSGKQPTTLSSPPERLDTLQEIVQKIVDNLPK